MLRRLIACVLALCLGLFSVEALVADVHDGDATRAELVAASARANASAHPDSHASALGDAPEQAPGEHAPGERGHHVHVCHDGHAHGASLPMVKSPGVPRALVGRAPFVGAARAPLTRALPPRLRPPIA